MGTVRAAGVWGLSQPVVEPITKAMPQAIPDARRPAVCMALSSATVAWRSVGHGTGGADGVLSDAVGLGFGVEGQLVAIGVVEADQPSPGTADHRGVGDL